MQFICSQAVSRGTRCGEPATHVVIEGHPFAMLFRSGAGLACKRHAKEYENAGGVKLSLHAFALAAQREWEDIEGNTVDGTANPA